MEGIYSRRHAVDASRRIKPATPFGGSGSRTDIPGEKEEEQNDGAHSFATLFLVDVGRGAKNISFSSSVGGSTPKPQEAKCKMFPNNNHVLGGLVQSWNLLFPAENRLPKKWEVSFAKHWAIQMEGWPAMSTSELTAEPGIPRGCSPPKRKNRFGSFPGMGYPAPPPIYRPSA